MEDLPEDKQVVDLLTKLKNSNGVYPSEMLAARRQMYQRQVSNVALGLGIGAGIKHVAKGGGGASGATTAVGSKVLETVLIAAITLEAGTATYLYRDKITNAVKSYLSKPTAQEVASPATNNESASNPELIPNTQVSPSTEPSATPSGSPSPVYGGPTTSNNTNGNNNSNDVNANVTPNPGGNNGNQYGLTPKPERTKDTGGNNNDGGGSNNGGGNNNGGGGNNNGGGNKKP